MRLAIILTSIVLLAVTGCTHVRDRLNLKSQDEKLASKNVDQVVDGFVDNGNFPFLLARVETLDGELLYQHAAVNRNLIPSLKINGNSWMRIWSMSKIVTIVTILDLAEDGVLKLSDPVSKYVPEVSSMMVAYDSTGKKSIVQSIRDPKSACPFVLKPQVNVMTIEHLLNHEAGFYYPATNVDCLDEALAKNSLEDDIDGISFMEMLKSTPLVQDPGTTYFYGLNTTILGFVAERVTGLSLEELVKQRITEPIGINGLSYHLPAKAVLPPRFKSRDGNLTIAEERDLNIFGGFLPRYNSENRLYLGGEGMVATAKGYAKFIRMILGKGALSGKRVLNEESVDLLVQPHTQINNPYGHNGYNIFIANGFRGKDNPPHKPGLWLGGGYEGTRYWIDPDLGLVGVFMTQVNTTHRANDENYIAVINAFYENFYPSE